METIVNPFEGDGFELATLTSAINILPNRYGLLEKKKLFPHKGVTTRVIIVEEKSGVLNLLKTMPVGSPGQQAKGPKRKIRSFVIPHIPHDDVILPDEYQGVRAFGGAGQASPIATIMNDKLQAMRNKHAITLEHLRMGALKGIILDADGSTIYNLYDQFGIIAKVIPFALSNAATKVRTKCLEVSRHIEDNLLGEVSDGVECLCSSEFFDDLIENDKVKEAFANHQAAIDKLGGDPRKGFEFGGINFIEYRGKATEEDGTVHRFIADGEAHCYPTGTMDSFATYDAPADFTETANTIGMPMYAKQKPRDFNRGIDLHTQSNPLAMCKRPGLLVKLTK